MAHINLSYRIEARLLLDSMDDSFPPATAGNLTIDHDGDTLLVVVRRDGDTVDLMLRVDNRTPAPTLMHQIVFWLFAAPLPTS